MTGMLARNAANPNLATNLNEYVTDSLLPTAGLGTSQGRRITLVLVIPATIIIAYITKALVGLRPSEEVEISGLDIAEHGEEGYTA